jgi:hypothetical protein
MRRDEAYLLDMLTAARDRVTFVLKLEPLVPPEEC